MTQKANFHFFFFMHSKICKLAGSKALLQTSQLSPVISANQRGATLLVQYSDGD